MRATLPGCKEFDEIGDGNFNITMFLGIGAVPGKTEAAKTLALILGTDLIRFEC